ncbi:MAG: hypothetical protein ACTS2F_29535 [Thainema sp.]
MSKTDSNSKTDGGLNSRQQTPSASHSTSIKFEAESSPKSLDLRHSDYFWLQTSYMFIVQAAGHAVS